MSLRGLGLALRVCGSRGRLLCCLLHCRDFCPGLRKLGAFGGLLGASLMFFLCGATLFGVALYWRRRKEVRRA